MARRICYQCHQEIDRGRHPPRLTDLSPSRRNRTAQFLMYRFGMVLLAAITFVVVRRTGELAYFLYGLGGVILFFTLSMAVRPRRPPRALDEPPDTDLSAHAEGDASDADRVDDAGKP